MPVSFGSAWAFSVFGPGSPAFASAFPAFASVFPAFASAFPASNFFSFFFLS